MTGRLWFCRFVTVVEAIRVTQSDPARGAGPEILHRTPAERGHEVNAEIIEKVPSKPKPFLRFARTTILAYVIAIFGLILIAAGA
jgi:hypothetical protein